VLAEMRASIGGTATGEPVESAPIDAEPEHPTTVPEDLLEREAEARAKVLGVSKADAVAELKGEKELVIEVSEPIEPQPKAKPEPAAAPLDAAAPEPVPAAPAASAPEPVPAAAVAAPAVVGGEVDWAAASASAGMPEKLFRRSVEAKAKAKGVDVAVVLAEMTGEPVPAAASAPAAPEPVPAAAVAAAAPAAVGGEVDWAAASASAGMPEKLFRRSVEAKAKAKGVDVAVVLAEMTGEPVPAAPAASAPATAPATAAVPAAAAPAPAAAAATIPKGVRPQRLLTVVKAKAIQQVKTTPSDKVSTWPHLLLIEFVALLAITALLIVMSVVIQAPLLEAANANVTPNPSKAPWYFLGLQELLTYFDPQIAGVTVPTIIGLIGFMAIPYIDRNPSNKPADRKFAIFMYTFFIMGAATLTIIGTLFRGKGFNFTYPWTDGIFFDDLKDWINFE
jgi:stalled ribosome alternative rescue factor ArfA